MRVVREFYGWNWTVFVNTLSEAKEVATCCLPKGTRTELYVYKDASNNSYLGRFECDSEGVIVWIPKKEN